MLQQVLAVCLVLGLLGATLWLLKRKGVARFNGLSVKAMKSSKAMAVVERMPLTAQHSLHLVRVLDRTILIGVSPSGCTPIAAFPGDSGLQAPERVECA
jgi:flagellar biosynthetic protein FliO